MKNIWPFSPLKVNLNMKNTFISRFFFILLLAGVSLLLSCTTNDKTETTETEETTTPTPAPPENMNSLSANEDVYAWVNNLNIREKPEMGSKVVATAIEQEALEFTGDKSAAPETIVLRGMAYAEPWLKVKTKDGTAGWVFGGAVKRKDETKGNDPISDDRFFYPLFGRFDLADWKKISDLDESGGDAEIITASYQKGGRVLEISRVDVGEYGYSSSYKLIDREGNVLRTRSFEFVGDGLNELNETVNDYTTNPPKKYIRTQKLNKHYMQLNGRPVMANGAWVESAADELPKAVSIGTAPANCPNMDADSGCNCDFKAGGNYVFRSDYKNGCLSLDGQIAEVTEVIFKDERTKLVIQSQSDPWIVLNEKGEDLIFGKKLEMGSRYKEHRAELVRTLLVMDEMPDQIQYQSNGTVGMGYRAEVRDMCAEAIQLAKEAKKKGETGPPSELRFENKDYKVYFTVQSTGRDDGGGNDYKGKMEVLAKDGTVLGSKQVTGYCGC
jgi:hypothetical protein